MTSVAQDAVDYTNDAQVRVCADTRVLVKKTMITTTAGTASYPLASDVIALRSMIDATGHEVTHLDTFAVMRLLSGTPDPTAIGYYTIGAAVGFYPTPTTTNAYTVFYEARPAVFTSTSELEVVGDAERLVDLLVQQMKLADDGQPELANAQLSFYLSEMLRVRARPRRQQIDRITTALG